jgi:UDP-glucose 4-epimerase
MKILITGGAGFIASHIADAYLRCGHEVWIIDDLSKGKRENLPKGAMFEKMDIRDERIVEWISRKQIELINHHAAHMDLRESVADPVSDADINVLGTLRLLDAARRAGAMRFIFASTGGAIYGEQKEFPARESHAAEPASPYGVSKLVGERYLKYFQQSTPGFQPQILRYANVYGPRQNPHGEAGVVAIFAEKMLAGESPLIHGDGRQTRDYIYIDDVVQANVLALESREPCLFNVGTGRETDVVTIFNHLKTFTGYTGDARHDEAKKGEQRRSVIDSMSIGKAWNWKPTVSLKDGLARTAQWFKDARSAARDS